MNNEENKIPQQEVPEIQETVEAEIVEEAPAAPDTNAELRASQERYMRLAAEYENFRKRSARERDALFTDVRADTVKKFLPVYDTLVRALKMMPAEDSARKGMEITPIEALGMEFNPELHHAVLTEDSDDYGENIVMEEFEKGFKLGDKVIRFSVVKVAN